MPPLIAACTVTPVAQHDTPASRKKSATESNQHTESESCSAAWLFVFESTKMSTTPGGSIRLQVATAIAKSYEIRSSVVSGHDNRLPFQVLPSSPKGVERRGDGGLIKCLLPGRFMSYTGQVSCPPQQNVISRNGRRMRSRKVNFVWVPLAAGLLAALLTGAIGRSVTETAIAQSSELPSLLLASPISGLTQPVSITHAGDGSGRIFVAQQNGQIRIIRNGTLSSTPFLNIAARISTGGERGLLGLAFPPGFANKQYFYVNYTNSAGNIVIARYRVSVGNADIADFNSEQIVIGVDHPNFANHNGGQLAFSPLDGFLYIGTGDGGSGGDPDNNADKDSNNLLGKVCVSMSRPEVRDLHGALRQSFIRNRHFYLKSGPGDARNPGAFRSTVRQRSLRRRCWTECLRRSEFSADRELGGGTTVGGSWRFPLFQSVNQLQHDWIDASRRQYGHGLGCSVTGGICLSGTTYPRMQGLFLWRLLLRTNLGLRRVTGVWQATDLLDTTIGISTFGEDEQGNLYVARLQQRHHL